MTDLIYRSFKNGKMLDEQGSLCFNISKGGSNMPDKIDSILKQFLVEVSALTGDRLKKVILYGSYARGDYDKNSDIDIMILTDFNETEIAEYRMKIRELACELETESDIIISPIVRNIEKYNNRINIIPFYMNVQKEGVVLNES